MPRRPVWCALPSAMRCSHRITRLCRPRLLQPKDWAMRVMANPCYLGHFGQGAFVLHIRAVLGSLSEDVPARREQSRALGPLATFKTFYESFPMATKGSGEADPFVITEERVAGWPDDRGLVCCSMPSMGIALSAVCPHVRREDSQEVCARQCLQAPEPCRLAVLVR